MSYGLDTNDLYRSASSYVDLILREAKISELPVQSSTKCELVINLKDRQGDRPRRARVSPAASRVIK